MINGTIGVRFARNCHPDDLWTSYFTSSGYVKEFRKQYGEPDVIQVRQTFPTDTLAREWEEKVIRRLDAVKSIRWLNRQNAGKDFYLESHTEESKEKMSKAVRKRVEDRYSSSFGR